MLGKHDCLQFLICYVEIHCDVSFPRGCDACSSCTRRIRGGRRDIGGPARIAEVVFGTNDVVECIIRKTCQERLVVKEVLELFGKTSVLYLRLPVNAIEAKRCITKFAKQ
jgi:hypothetical protein